MSQSQEDKRTEELRSRRFWAENQLKSLKDQKRELERKLLDVGYSIERFEAVRASCVAAICSPCCGTGKLRETVSEDFATYRKCPDCNGSGFNSNFK